ncbi:MAG TPA: STAS domain-containing protein [Acidimicrobiales bacterium]|nr:STAS domain-containing protein [Acidimicrobiales bacterium]
MRRRTTINMFTNDGKPLVSTDCDSDGYPLVRVRGEIDVSNADQLAAALEAAIRPRPARMVIDLSETTFMDGAAVGRIVALRREVSTGQCSIVLRHPQAIVRRLIDVLGVDRLCEVEDLEGVS